jgi:hypothetical protein
VRGAIVAEAVRTLARPHPCPLPEVEGGTASAVDRAAADLQYAPPPPLRQRRVVRRVLLILALVALVGAGVYYFPQAREQALIYACQRRCMGYQPPANQVVFDDDPVRAAGLLSDPRYGTTAGGTTAFLVPRPWADLYAHLSPPGLKSNGTVFLGAMTTADGRRRLIAIDLTVNNASRSKDSVLLMARVIEPGNPVRRPRLLSTYGAEFLHYELKGPVTPGQVDPQDPTHVVLFNGKVDGWLQGDSVKLRPRAEVPATARFIPPAPSSPASPRSSGPPATRPSADPGAR